MRARLSAAGSWQKPSGSELGKKGDPYRFQMLRTDAAQATAQNGAESDLAGIPLSAAPRRGAERESTPAAILDAALCAETQVLA
jgi:hypothetical protein